MRNLSPREQDRLKARVLKVRRNWPVCPDIGQLQDIFTHEMRRFRAVGAALSLIGPEGDETLCYGKVRLDAPDPVTSATCFRIASVTKTVTALGFLALQQDGLLSLDQDLTQVLGPSLRHPRYPDTPITPRMLLTHTAGLLDSPLYFSKGQSRQMSWQELLLQPDSWGPMPGAGFHYTNFGAGLLGPILHAVTGLDLQQYMQGRIFGSLGIAAGYGPRYLPGRQIADGYHVSPLRRPRLSYDARKQATVPAPDPAEDFLSAVGSLVTDSPGLCALARLLAAKEDTPVLGAASLHEMRQIQDGRGQILSAGRGLGLSFMTGVFPDISPVGHQGTAYGMLCEVFADPNTGLAAAFMTNGALLGHLPVKAPGMDAVTLALHTLLARTHPSG